MTGAGRMTLWIVVLYLVILGTELNTSCFSFPRTLGNRVHPDQKLQRVKVKYCVRNPFIYPLFHLLVLLYDRMFAVVALWFNCTRLCQRSVDLPRFPFAHELDQRHRSSRSQGRKQRRWRRRWRKDAIEGTGGGTVVYNMQWECIHHSGSTFVWIRCLWWRERDAYGT